MPTMRERIGTFEVLDGHLVRSVVPVRGKPLRFHATSRASMGTRSPSSPTPFRTQPLFG